MRVKGEEVENIETLGQVGGSSIDRDGISATGHADQAEGGRRRRGVQDHIESTPEEVGRNESAIRTTGRILSS